MDKIKIIRNFGWRFLTLTTAPSESNELKDNSGKFESLQKFSALLKIPPERLNYLVNIDDKRRIAYFETPKVACTSIKKLMQDIYIGYSTKRKRQSDIHNRQLSPLKTLNCMEERQVEEVLFGNYKRFTFIRNPYSRFLSAYLDKIVNDEEERLKYLPMLGFKSNATPSVSEVLEKLGNMADSDRDIHFASQTHLTMCGNIKFTKIGNFESFNYSTKKILKHIYCMNNFCDNLFNEKKHKTGASDKLNVLITEKESKMIRDIYKHDFENFGYCPEIERAKDIPMRTA